MPALTNFSKLLFILYKVPLDIGHSSTLAYTVNKCTPALWLRFTGLPWGRGSGQLNLGRLSLMPPSGSTGKLQAPRGTSWAQPCGCTELRASVLNSFTLRQHRALSNYSGQNHAHGKESYSGGKMSPNTQAPAPGVGLKTDAKRG